MKRILSCLLILTTLLLSLAGCQAAPPKEEGTSLPAESSEAPTPSEEARPLPDESNEETTGEPAPAISLHSMDDLQKMRDMCASAEEDELERYLCSIEGGGATSRKDLETFLEAVDSLPLLSLVEGDISWISYHNFYPELTPERNSVIYITVQKAPDEWVRTGYFIGVQDVDAELKRRTDRGDFEASALKEPFYSKDGRVAVYTEAANDAFSSVTWIMTVDGILAETVYHTESPEDLRAETVFKDPVIGSLQEN
ncbi:MAG: hypothetical protein II325_00325 [Clostridia bacterium]|nr:hypothetical protein [Clostridia bacterium]